ncbi:MAG: hypothetical protein NVSMB19_01390 [Vulcanimicrobiaceae bacterium]
MNMRFVALGAAVLCIGVGAGGSAVAGPAPAPTPTPVNLPSLPPPAGVDPYTKAAIDILTGVVKQQITNYQNSSSGQVSYFKRFEMQINTGRDQYRSIHLHQGTEIDPIGQSIRVGQRVDVSGVTNADGSINANKIVIHQ